MRISIIGATGRTGKILTSLAISHGHKLQVLVRDAVKLGDLKNSVSIISGSSADPLAVRKAVEGVDSVAIVLGHAKGSPPDVLSRSTNNVIRAMTDGGVRRVALLSNAAIFQPGDSPGVCWRVVGGFTRVSVASIVRDHRMAAEALIASDLDWTLVRPVWLTNGPMTKAYTTGAIDSQMGITVARTDVAAFLLSSLSDPSQIHRTPAIAKTRTGVRE